MKYPFLGPSMTGLLGFGPLDSSADHPQFTIPNRSRHDTIVALVADREIGYAEWLIDDFRSEKEMLRRLGIFGGSFDPIHYGHLLIAESCREQCGLDQVWLLPASVPPHKRARQLTADRQRVEMVRLAVGGHRSLAVSTLEIDRGGVSYTADTLAMIHRQHPGAELFVLMGADTLVDLPNWRQPREICEMAIPVAVRRCGSPPPQVDVLSNLVSAERLEQIRSNQVEMPLVELTSTDIRQRVARGGSIRYRTPRAVEKYIESHGLYTAGLNDEST